MHIYENKTSEVSSTQTREAKKTRESYLEHQKEQMDQFHEISLWGKHCNQTKNIKQRTP